MPQTRTIVLSPDGHSFTVLDTAEILLYQGPTNGIENHYDVETGALTMLNTYNGRIILNNLLYGSIINGQTNLPFTSLTELATFMAANFFQVSGGGGGSALATPVLLLGTPTESSIPLSLEAAVPNALQYIYQRANDNLFTSGVTVVYEGSDTSYVNTGLTGDTTYYYRVKATASGEGYVNSPWSLPQSATTTLPKLATPVLTIDTQASTAITGSATTPTGATSFVWQAATNVGFTTGVRTLSATTDEFNDTGLPNSTDYYYRVKATGTGYTDSNFTDPVKATTLSASGLVPLLRYDPTLYAGGMDITGNTMVSDDPGAYQMSVGIIPAGEPFIVQIDKSLSVNDGGYILVSKNLSEAGFGTDVPAAVRWQYNSPDVGRWIGRSNGEYYDSPGSVTYTGIPMARLRGTGTAMFIEYSFDEGDTWTAITVAGGIVQENVPYRVAGRFQNASDIQNIQTTPLSYVAKLSTVNAAESKFDHVYLADAIFTTEGVKAVAGDEIDVYQDQVGDVDIVYGGSNTPTITGLRPQLVTYPDGRLFVEYLNRPLTISGSGYYRPKSPPFKIWHVFVQRPGQQFEAISSGGGNCAYQGDVGALVRIYKTDGILATTPIPTRFQTACTMYEVNADNTIDYYENNVYKDSIALEGGDIDNFNKIYNTIAVDTNSTDFDLKACYIKFGEFANETERDDTYAGIKDKHNIETMDDEVRGHSFKWTRTGSGPYTYTPSMILDHTPTGVTLKPFNEGLFEWFWMSDEGNFGLQTLFKTTYTVSTGDFPANDGSHTNVKIKFNWQAVDTDNNPIGRKLSGVFNLITATESIQN